jgi:hypothetical protein
MWISTSDLVAMPALVARIHVLFMLSGEGLDVPDIQREGAFHAVARPPQDYCVSFDG